MKKQLATVLSLFSLLIVPAPAFALFNVNQGGTGVASFPTGAFIFGNGINPLGATYAPSFSFVNATTTNATSTFSGNVDVTGAFTAGVHAGLPALLVNTDPGGVIYYATINTDLRLGDGAGSIVFTDFPFTTEWSHLYGFGPNQISLQKPTGGDAVLDFTEISDQKFFAFPNYSGTFGLLEANQSWTGANTFSQGAVGTTTVNFGHMGSSTSKVCFNTKNTDGADISFYFVGTSMVVENNVCQ